MASQCGSFIDLYCHFRRLSERQIGMWGNIGSPADWVTFGQLGGRYMIRLVFGVMQ
jgi:hypothetical protein